MPTATLVGAVIGSLAATRNKSSAAKPAAAKPSEDLRHYGSGLAGGFFNRPKASTASAAKPAEAAPQPVARELAETKTSESTAASPPAESDKTSEPTNTKASEPTETKADDAESDKAALDPLCSSCGQHHGSFVLDGVMASLESFRPTASADNDSDDGERINWTGGSRDQLEDADAYIGAQGNPAEWCTVTIQARGFDATVDKGFRTTVPRGATIAQLRASLVLGTSSTPLTVAMPIYDMDGFRIDNNYRIDHNEQFVLVNPTALTQLAKQHAVCACCAARVCKKCLLTAQLFALLGT